MAILRVRVPLISNSVGTYKYELCTYMNLAGVLVGGWFSDAPHFCLRESISHFKVEFVGDKIY